MDLPAVSRHPSQQRMLVMPPFGVEQPCEQTRAPRQQPTALAGHLDSQESAQSHRLLLESLEIEGVFRAHAYQVDPLVANHLAALVVGEHLADIYGHPFAISIRCEQVVLLPVIFGNRQYVPIGIPVYLVRHTCVVESEQLQMDVAGQLKEITSELGINFLFKSSFDKANRSSGTWKQTLTTSKANLKQNT